VQTYDVTAPPGTTMEIRAEAGVLESPRISFTFPTTIP
jgi:hypothetical protein